MNKLKISYVDWWDSGVDFIFSKILKRNYEIEFTNPNNSDLIFCGPFGNEKNKFDKFKIYYTGENTRNPENVNFKFNYNIDSDFRIPIYYVMSNEYTEISKVRTPLLLENRRCEKRDKFCGFLVSNPSNNLRNEVFKKINEYKKVDSGGSVYNNIGYKVKNTIEWMSEYKFFICFENSKYDYYITEKLINAYHAGCVPIYWGSDTVSEELNENSFINCNKIERFDELIDIINEIDTNDDLYNSYLREPLLKDDKYDSKFSPGSILDLFIEIIEKNNLIK